MANITEILGTDSISGSRKTINDNFNLLNEQLVNLTDFLDPDNSILDINTINTEELNISKTQSGNTQAIADFNGNRIKFSIDLRSESDTELQKSVIKSGKRGTISNPVQSLQSSDLNVSTIMTDSNLDIPAGNKVGHEVTFIFIGTSNFIDLTSTSAALATTGDIRLNGKDATVTLRWLNDGSQLKWFVIGGHNYEVQ